MLVSLASVLWALLTVKIEMKGVRPASSAARR